LSVHNDDAISEKYYLDVHLLDAKIIEIVSPESHLSADLDIADVFRSLLEHVLGGTRLPQQYRELR
jgi:hypothetical protein